LFWWIAKGVIDPEGNALMPGFGSVLSEDDIWTLIDFIRARNIGPQAADTGAWAPPVAAPTTPLSCAGRDADELAGSRAAGSRAAGRAGGRRRRGGRGQLSRCRHDPSGA
jgi:hypothetical protein